MFLVLLLQNLPFVTDVFIWLNQGVLAIDRATKDGASFMFGYLGGGATPFEVKNPASNFIIAFQVLPVVIVTSALSALLFHWGVLQVLVKGFSKLLEKTMGASGAMGLGVAANVFLGIIEAPVFIRPYLKSMSRGELFTVLVSGMATVAGTVFVLYASILKDILPNATGEIIVASLMSAPAAIMIAQILIPIGEKRTKGDQIPTVETKSGFEAVIRGTNDGVQMALGIAGVIVVLFAIVSLVNQGLALLPTANPTTIQGVLGLILTPFVWAIGLPWEEAISGGELLGIKTVLNEFVAYVELSKSGDVFSERSRIILTYALCGFANFGSLGILVGGLGAIVPERIGEILGFGFKLILAGLMSTMLTGALVGLTL